MAINIPASIGMPSRKSKRHACSWSLIAFERNVAKMAKFIKENGLRHRGHAKCHKSADIAAYLRRRAAPAASAARRSAKPRRW